jgi:Outer membrane protein beta-barrel domain
MNKWLLTATLLFLSVAGFSQVSIGSQLSGVISNPSIKSTDLFDQSIDAKSMFGWKAGFVFDVPFGEDGWRFMPEINWVNKGFKVDLNTTYLTQPVSVKGNSNIGYIELPLNIAYAVEMGDNNLIIGAGPYLAYGVAGKNDFEGSVGSQVVVSNNEKIDFGSDPGQVKPFDYGANLTVGYLLHAGMMLRANYNLGLANISNEGNGSSYKNSYFGFSLIYFFKRAGE